MKINWLSSIILGFSMAAALALGIGTMNCFLISRYQVWQQIWSIINRPLFLVSCVFFLFETIPAPYNDYLWWNEALRRVFLQSMLACCTLWFAGFALCQTCADLLM